MSLTSISKGNQSNDFNAPSTIKIFLAFLYFYGRNKLKVKMKRVFIFIVGYLDDCSNLLFNFFPICIFLVTQLCQQSSSYFRIFSQNFIIFVKRYFIIITNFCSSKVTFTKISKVLHIGSFQFSFKVNFIRGSVLP